MKFSIERAILVKAANQAQAMVERRAVIPILLNVLIEATPQGVSFRATDNDAEIIERAEAVVEQPGATTVSAQMLNEIARKLPDGALVQITSDDAGGRIVVQAGRTKFNLATLPKEDFPTLASTDYKANFKAKAADLRRLFGKSRFAMSNEETRFYLNGVYLHVAQGDHGPVLRAVATDGHRLALVDVDLPDGAADMPGVIVPRKTVGEVMKLFDGAEDMIAVSVSETKIRFATPNLTISSKVVDGTFPDYSRVIPYANARKLVVDAADFARAVDRVATVTSEKTRAVKLTLDQDRVILSANSPDTGAAEEELIVSYGDDPLEIGFNAKYLHEIANQVDRDNAEVMLNGAGDPALVREGSDTSALYVVMPMRV